MAEPQKMDNTDVYIDLIETPLCRGCGDAPETHLVMARFPAGGLVIEIGRGCELCALHIFEGVQASLPAPPPSPITIDDDEVPF